MLSADHFHTAEHHLYLAGAVMRNGAIDAEGPRGEGR